MQFISLNERDYEILEKNIFRVFKLYYGDKKGRILSFGLLYYGNETTKNYIRKGLIFFLNYKRLYPKAPYMKQWKFNNYWKK